ncbi:Crp/Fnr family transcriptional regulator [Roseomonas nepalensis]|uniref:Crp/Fnr family transcriptional regulator n=1 Tax=Muricoccus nepalensis TaxID=1854500 RepID=A0A502EVD2_9PROT|nr:Crp/Fnr family transcriptional regulator [Roseomonas nepalensis]TPG41875.1 Crp/Fnr family transcriptional regulator [Roseomonas nepalensis]
MTETSPAAAFCLPCPVRRLPIFEPFTEGDLAFVMNTWRARRAFTAEADILRPDEAGSALYTLWEGWAYRFRALPGTTSEGRPRRQILDILLPGDTIGLESTFTGASAHGVRALTPVQVCAHDPRAFGAISTACPGLCQAMMVGDQLDLRRLDERLTQLGRASATQRLGFTMLDLHDRLADRELVTAGEDGAARLPWPLQRRHLADLLGLSGAHVTRSMAELRAAGLAAVEGDALVLRDRARLAAFCEYAPAGGTVRRGVL